MKFQSDVAGTITGLRFYQGPGNASPHGEPLDCRRDAARRGPLRPSRRDLDGARRSSPRPSQSRANTVYVASYFSPQGSYAVDLSFFVPAVQQASAPQRRRVGRAVTAYSDSGVAGVPDGNVGCEQLLGRRLLRALLNLTTARKPLRAVNVRDLDVADVPLLVA